MQKKMSASADEPKQKRQKRLSHFFSTHDSTADKKPLEKSKEHHIDESPKSFKEDNKEKSKMSMSKTKREFNQAWLEKNSWLQYENNKMTCKICMSEGKDNPFTSGCQNFRNSTLLRHIASNQHKAALEAQSLRHTMSKQTMGIISKKNEAVTGAMRCVYWLGKEHISTTKYKSLLNLHRIQGCTFPDELQAGAATYTSSQTAEEMQDALASVLKESVNDKLSSSPYISILLDESCDISVSKKLLLYAKTITDEFDVETHFVENVNITDGTALTIYETVKRVLKTKGIPMSKVVAVGSDGASVMTGSKNGFVALVKKNDSPFLLGVHCMAHRLALCSSQAAEKVPYLKEYQQVLSDIFYHFKRSALRREKVKEIQSILDEPHLQYKELHSVRWFSMYNALDTIYRTWGSLATYFESQMEASNDSTCKGFFKKVTTYTFIAVTHLLMDIIPRVTQLSLFLQKECIDLAMIRPTVESVIQQLTWLKTNDGHYMSEFVSVTPAENMKKFKDIKVTDKPVLRQQFKKVRDAFLTKLISEIERRFPAEATDIVSNMAVFSLRGLSLLSEEERKYYGTSQLQSLTKHFGIVIGDNAPFIDEAETLLEWERCKALVFQQSYPCNTIQSIWKLLLKNHTGAFPNLSKLATVAMLAPLQTATVERGFSTQNIIKVSARNRLSGDRLNTLMQIALGPPVADFDFPNAVSTWKKTKQRKLFSSNHISTPQCGTSKDDQGI